MALGAKENADGYFLNSVAESFGTLAERFSGMGNIQGKRRRRKTKKHRVKTRRAHNRKHRRKRTKVKITNFKKRSGKRPYPHWLKKYWFKKK